MCLSERERERERERRVEADEERDRVWEARDVGREEGGERELKKKGTVDLLYQSLFTGDDAQKEVDFDTPWKLGLTYNWNYTRNYTTFFSSVSTISSQKESKKKNTQSIDFNGDFNLTKKWKFGIEGKYNITDKKFIYDATKVLINRDLHCWETHYEWNPFGETSKYDFSIGIKAEALKL